MSHFAEIDNNNVVLRVIVAEQDFINSGVVGDSFKWVQTSYNKSFRSHFAVVGGTYNPTTMKFALARPYASWALSADNEWEPPTPYPAGDLTYIWNEDMVSWDEVPNPML